jgi:hypothetical protein
MGLHRITFDQLTNGMIISRENLKVLEVLVADKHQVMFMKDAKTAAVMTKEEFEKDAWFTATKRKGKKSHG